MNARRCSGDIVEKSDRTSQPRTPQLNGKVERPRRTDKDEFYQLLTYRDDVDLEKKLAEWERFYTTTGHTALTAEERHTRQ